MLVNKISFTPSFIIQQQAHTTQTAPPNMEEPSVSLTPAFAYRDYDINFGARLFRTPANFYEQSFNQKNMPATMKEYLNADYEDRQNIPPNQMLRIVFDDLNEIKTLDFVPRVFPNEPLFENVSDTPKRNARTGILSEIQSMTSEMDEYPLFKDGNSNFGMYLLKKIYLEGKTLKEINKDFKQDLSKAYDGLITSEIDYDTLSAYGIKFPKTPFWKSFIATREDFPYEYKPRKIEISRLGQQRERSLADITAKRNQDDTRPPKFKVDKNFDPKGKKMGDAIIDGHGSIKHTEKALRRRGISNQEELSFVSKYMSEIMSIALEKTHASEEMRSYFENYDNMNKRQKEKMDNYWKSNPFMRDLQSLAISDTIKLFYEAYGADGNNEEFQDLLKYANNIKPARQESIKNHDLKQLELEETFANYPLTDLEQAAKEETPTVPEPKILTQEEMDKLAEEVALKNGAEVFEFTSPDGDRFKIFGNIDELYKNKMEEEFALMPQKLVQKFINFAQKSKYATHEYKKTAGLIANVPGFALEQLMPIDECRNISAKINKDFDSKYRIQMLAGEQAFAERLLAIKGDKYVNLLRLNAMELSKYAMNELNITKWSEEDQIKLDQDYEYYSTSLKNKDEISKLNMAFVEYLSNTNPDSANWKPFGEIDDICALLAATLIKYPDEKKNFNKMLRQSQFMERYGASARILLKPDVSPDVKKAKVKLMMSDLIAMQASNVINILSKNSDFIRKYVKDPNVAMGLLQRHFANKQN